MYTHPLTELVANKPFLENIVSQFGTPLYLYSGPQIEYNLTQLDAALKKNFNSYHICYAIKANSNPHLLRFMRTALPTLGGDCSSPGELYAANQAGFNLKDCIYTGNYESSADLQAAWDAGCHINLDDITSFQRLQNIGIPREVSFRLNPGFGKGTFEQITTAGKEAKFGIPEHKIDEAYRLAMESGVQTFGLQCMTGSGILEEDYFQTLVKAITGVSLKLRSKLGIDLKFISIGGGFGIPYREEDKPLNIDRVFTLVKEQFQTVYDPMDPSSPALWVEPGKFTIGNAGLLLARVTGIKHSYKTFVGLDCGMETLMRPSLYKAHHRIVKVGDVDAPHNQTVDITGRICENTDRLAVNRSFPDVKEGELIAVMDTGAYGFSMAHQFNTRPRPAEVLLHHTTPKLIRRRETIEDLFTHSNL